MILVTMAFEALPGRELVLAGLDDLAHGKESVPALLVSIGAPRLARLGIAVEDPIASPEHRLYLRLAESNPDSAHSRYNALIRRLVSFERAAEVEVAAPDQFIPEVPGWEGRSILVGREGRLSFLHYDLYSQALAKIERGHEQDRKDVDEMLKRGLVDPTELRKRFAEIEPFLYRFPAVDPKAFRQALEAAVRS